MKKPVKIVVISFAILVALGVGVTTLSIWAGYKHHMKGYQACELVLKSDREVIMGLIMTEREAYVTLSDMVFGFEPFDYGEAQLHLQAMKKLLSCLKELKGEMENHLDDLLLEQGKSSV